MRFGILGVLSVDGIEITAGRDRVVLAMLLLHANRIVPVDRLIDALWETEPPATARGQLQTCVSRLRRALPGEVIRTDPAGYGIELTADDLDALRFDDLVAAGRIREALDLWRGPALSGIDSPVVRRSAAGWDERHAETAEAWAADGAPIAYLSTLVQRFPARERLRGHLMRALAGAGRRADALAEFRDAREHLMEDLGIEPGAELQELHRQILNDEVTAPAPAPVRVRALPRAVSDFTGRSALLLQLRTQVEAAPAGPLVQVIDGMAGVGKTTLAVHLAGLVADRYPDAHLFIDLHGQSDRGAEEPGDALVTLLRQIGVPPERIPERLDGQVALWRSELAGRRVLVVLDNAATSAQVRPLLPGSGDNLTLVTSRRRLTGLDGVRPEPVDLLDEAEAVDLFTQIVGDRARAEPAATLEVVRRCGLLPLGVRLAGARLAHRQRWQVADLVRRLGEAALPELVAEDRTVAAAFALSYTQLPAQQQRLFRLLGLHPGERFDVTAVAALAGLDRAATEDLLDSLVDVHLVGEPDPGRYRLHDLVREYAQALVQTDSPAARESAVDALLAHTVHSLAALSFPLELSEIWRRAGLPEPPRPDLLPGSDVSPMTWIDTERGNLVAVQVLAESVGAHREVWMLARAGWRLWYQRQYHGDLIDAHFRGLAAARALADPNAEMMMCNYLASGLHRVGRVREAAALLESAHERFGGRHHTTVPDHALLSNLSVLKNALGEFGQAADLARRSLLAGTGRSHSSMMVANIELGTALDRLGDLAGSLAHHRRALSLAAESGSEFSQYSALTNVADVRLRMGHAVAERHARLAIVLNRRIGNTHDVAGAHTAIGVHRRRQGRYAESIAELEAALEARTHLNEAMYQAAALVELGRTLLESGDRATAATTFRRAQDLARPVDARYEEACALAGLAEAIDADDPERAGTLAARALALFREMGTPEQHDVEKWLTGR